MQFMIKINRCEGIPMANSKTLEWKNFIRREVGVCLFDKLEHKFVGNTIYIPAVWNESTPDEQVIVQISSKFRWQFKNPYPIIFQFGDFDSSIHSSCLLVFEFICYLKDRVLPQLHSISTCHAQIPLVDLKLQGKLQLGVLGGSPLNSLNIDPSDIHVAKGFFSSKSNVKPMMEIELIKVPEKEKKLLTEIQVFPTRYIVPKLWTPLIYIYRQYLGYRAVKKGELDIQLSSDFKVKGFLNALNVPDLGDWLGNWWTLTIEQFFLVITEYYFQKENKSSITSNQFKPLRSYRTDFQLPLGNPTQRMDHVQETMKMRQICFRELTDDVQQALGLGPGGILFISRKSYSYFNQEPMNLLELMDQDDEDEIKAFEKVLSRIKRVN